MKLWVTDDEFGEDFQVEVPVASVVAALIAEGGQIVESASGYPYTPHKLVVSKPGRYLVHGPIPVEKEPG